MGSEAMNANRKATNLKRLHKSSPARGVSHVFGPVIVCRFLTCFLSTCLSLQPCHLVPVEAGRIFDRYLLNIPKQHDIASYSYSQCLEKTLAYFGTVGRARRRARWSDGLFAHSNVATMSNITATHVHYPRHKP